MMQNRKIYLNEMLNDRGNVIRFISITILLSFGLNVIAGSITLTSGFNHRLAFGLEVLFYYLFCATLFVSYSRV